MGFEQITRAYRRDRSMTQALPQHDPEVINDPAPQFGLNPAGCMVGPLFMVTARATVGYHDVEAMAYVAVQ
jgi:hypothetical protein